MTLINFSPLQDGVTGVIAAATNTPLSTIYNDYNGNITDANISASAAIATSKLALSSAWTSWTPTLTSATVGNGVFTCKYIQIGKTVHYHFKFVLGSTSAIASNAAFSLPVTTIADYASQHPMGQVMYYSGSTWYQGWASWSSSTVAQFLTNSTSTIGGITSTSPFTWATGNAIYASGTYEAA